MSSKKRRNLDKRAATAKATQGPAKLFGFWSILGMICGAAILLIGATAEYERRQDLEALLTPDDTVAGRATDTGDDAVWSLLLPSQLANFETDASIGKEVSEVQADLEQYRVLRSDAFQKAAGLRIDYIAYEHYAPGLFLRGVINSQEKPRKLLDNLGEDSIGVEGSICDVVSIPCLINDMDRQTRASGNPVAPSVLRDALFQDVMPAEAGLGYFRDNPGASVTGLEMHHLHFLHNSVLALLASNHPQYDGLAALLSAARSDMAIARMVTFMKKNKKRQGVFIFGFNHETRLKETMARIGIISRIYRTQ